MATHSNKAKRRYNRLARKAQAKKRGMVLLVTVSLLTLFLLIGITFAVISTVYRDSARIQAQLQLDEDEPSKLLESALYMFVRDPNDNDVNNPLRGQGILRDRYGASYRATVQNDTSGYGIKVVGWNDNSSGSGVSRTPGLLEFNVNFNGTVPQNLQRTYGHFSGCVLTFLSGPLKYVTTRIVQHDVVDDGSGNIYVKFVVLAPPESAVGITYPINGNTELLINGRDFAGAGAGFDSMAMAAPWMGDAALKPNRKGESYANLYANYLQAGANESYDAPDYQNAYLAALIPDPMNENKLKYILPSFHDRALINYWQTNGATDDYRFTFRPILNDYSGAIPAGAAFPALQVDSANTPPQWVGDVDNDNDGIPDSVWIDVGFPVRRSSTGRLVKPLIAFLCIDLDGRFNANFHGSFVEAYASKYAPGSPPTNIKAPRNDHSVLAGWQSASTVSATSTSSLPTGAGWGPPEISLKYLLTNSSAPSFTNYEIFFGNGNYFGRYGQDLYPGRQGFDYPSMASIIEVPADYANATSTGYMSQPDPHGRLAQCVNPYGSPHQPVPTAMGYDERTDTDYELRSYPGYSVGNVGSAAVLEQPFSPSELEALLRMNDVDAASLPQRLINIIGNNRRNQLLLTTESFDHPGPASLAVGYLQDTSTYNLPGISAGSFANLAAARLINEDSSLSSNPALLKQRLKQLFSWELLRGEKMDLNRPFGNGFDDTPMSGSNNGVVDEPQEMINPNIEYMSQLQAYTGGSTVTTIVNANTVAPTTIGLNNSGTIKTSQDASNQLDPRLLMARHLYCLAMLFVDKNIQVDLDNNGTQDTAQDVAKAVAQWAVNVVDFRDADSINTGFEYDINPFDGWDVDDNLSPPYESNRGIVWGCERPELIMTETLFTHDRKTEDTDQETDVPMTDQKKYDADPAKQDNDWDQRLIPEGLGYIELFNPWAGTDRRGAEINSLSGNIGVRLNQVTPNDPNMASTQCPVWRILVVKGAPVNNFDPDAPNALSTSPVKVERSVYFTSISGLNNQATNVGATLDHGLPFYPNIAGLSPLPVAPGRYAVIGSSGRTDTTAYANQYFGFLGRNNTHDENVDLTPDGTRRIVLNPSANTVQVLDNTDTTNPDPNPGVPVTVIPINAPRSFNISDDPTELGALGYPSSKFGGQIPSALTSQEMALEKPVDKPFDTDPDLVQDQTKRAYRMLFLQRLANPLKAWHPTSNPYLTLDSRPADLIAFNGVASGDPKSGAGMWDVSSFEQGHNEAPSTSRQLWNQSPLKAAPAGNDPDGGYRTDHVFDYKLKHSLGLINTNYQPYCTVGAANPFTGAPDTSGNKPAFPWLCFPNRPLNGALEILSVPRTSQSQLLSHCKYGTPTGMYGNANYTFGHLMNYWHSDASSGAEKSLNLHRIFEYVTIPSRFTDAKHVFDFNDTKYVPGASPTGLPTGYQLAPPFNWVSTFRDPAKPNINTIYSQSLWNAIMNGRSNPTWNELVDSRRGYGMAGDGIVSIDTSVPTFVGNPFRAEGAGGLVPSSAAGQLKRSDVDCTLMRTKSITPPGALTNEKPLFEDIGNTQPYNDYTQHPYFYTENLHRMGNLVGTKSNVFAIWVTVGYFDVDTDYIDRDKDGNPDDINGDMTVNGLDKIQQLGAEVGSDSGQVERHRAFYIFDRSIPVAFEPGENHNVDKAILVRRMIE